MVDYVSVQQGDLDDAATVNVVVGHGNLADYVGYGLGLNADFASSPQTVTVSEGKLFVLLPTQNAPGAGHDKHDCLATAHYESRTKDLVTSGVNYVWARLNIGTRDSPKIDITDTDTAPSTDSVKIGEVDTSTEATTEFNREPDGNYEGLTAQNLDVGDSITWPDGETTTGHPLTYGEPIENQNNYYDASATDPPGVVAEADHAATADSATSADSAANADLATDSDHLEGNTLNQVLDKAKDEVALEWEPRGTGEVVWDHRDTTEPLAISWTVDPPNYDHYRLNIQADNYESWPVELTLTLNTVHDEIYRSFTLNPSDHQDAPESYDEIGGERRDEWVVGTVGGNAQSYHEIIISNPEPVIDSPPSKRYPMFTTDIAQPGMPRSHRMMGSMAKDVSTIRHIGLRADSTEVSARARLYGKNGV